MFWFHLISTSASPFITDCQKSISHLQLVQNAVARILTDIPFHHSSSKSAPARRFKKRKGITPRYADEPLVPYELQCCLNSSGKALLVGSSQDSLFKVTVLTQLGCLCFKMAFLMKLCTTKQFHLLNALWTPTSHKQAFNVIWLYCVYCSIFLHRLNVHSC